LRVAIAATAFRGALMFRNRISACLLLTCAVAVIAPVVGQAKGFHVLYTFSGSDGRNPDGPLLRDKDGSLYGTTWFGGAENLGTVFKLAADRTETALHSFAGGADGLYPRSNLIVDSSGDFYGVTEGGGANDYGTVFKIAPDGTETVLHSFDSGTGTPYGLTADRAGNLYGFSGEGRYGYGMVFELAPDGTETALYSFKPVKHGYLPLGSLLIDKKGNLYSTTSLGGQVDLGGTVFKLAPDGKEKVLYSFTAGSDGGGPSAGVIRDSAGNFYGTAGNYGNNNCDYGCGTVFRLAPDGTETTLYSFTGGSDGGWPYNGVIADSAGNLYGAGSYGKGTIFKVASDGSETTLYTFSGGSDGSDPNALIMSSKGHLYGTTYSGGANGYGVVFEFSQ